MHLLHLPACAIDAATELRELRELLELSDLSEVVDTRHEDSLSQTGTARHGTATKRSWRVKVRCHPGDPEICT